MAKKEILEYNKRCAEFMYPNAKEEYESGQINITDGIFKKAMLIFGHFDMMKYHSDWNWVMEVLQAVEKIGAEYSLKNKSFALSYTISEEWYAKETIFKGDAPIIDEVTSAINQFLIWHKNQT